MDKYFWILLVTLPKTLNHNIFVERDHLKMYFKNVLIQLIVFKKDQVYNLKNKSNKISSNIWLELLSLIQ
jgi:hypothetical protein